MYRNLKHFKKNWIQTNHSAHLNGLVNGSRNKVFWNHSLSQTKNIEISTKFVKPDPNIWHRNGDYKTQKQANSSVPSKEFCIPRIHTKSAAKWTNVGQFCCVFFQFSIDVLVFTVRSKHILGMHKFDIQFIGERCNFTPVHHNDLSSLESFRNHRSWSENLWRQ